MSFLLYHLAKYSRSQNVLYKEIVGAYPNADMIDFNNISNETPYLQACIKETLRYPTRLHYFFHLILANLYVTLP